MIRHVVSVIAALVATSATAQTNNVALSRASLEAQLKANFARTDANKDGFVSPAEAELVRQSAMAAQFNAAFAALDTNKDGSISKAEFVGANTKAANAQMAQQNIAQRAFAAGDLNKDGRIALAEAIAGPLKAFDAVDADRNGSLTLAERQAAQRRASKR